MILREWLFRLRALLTRRRMDRDLDDEMRDHLAHQITWHVDRGASPADARRQALLDLGTSVEALKEGIRDARGTSWFDDARRDVVYALRMFRRSPGFAAVATTSLALGIGANAVVFGLVNAFLLKPLPIRSPGQVVFIERTSGGSTQSFPDYRDFRDRTTAFIGLAAFRLAPMGVAAGASTNQAWGYLVTGNYFDMLGVRPWLGRLLSATDDGAAGSNPVVVLSYAYWRAQFGGDPSLVGRTIGINTRSYTVVGIAPPRFQGTERFFWPDLWVPMSMQPEIESVAWLDSRGTFNTDVVGRLAPGVTTTRATADLNAIAASLAREYPATDTALSVRLTRPGWLGDALGAPVSAFTRGLMALALLVLLAACANLASLVAARATDRRRELAIRLAIGAGRWRIVRQLLAETLVLAVAGGAAGAALAAACLGAFSRWRVIPQFPIAFDVAADWRVAAFGAAATLVAGLLFGLAPARLAWTLDLQGAWKSAATRPVTRRWSGRDLLVGVQVAICGALVLSAFLAARSLARAAAAPIGIRPERVDLAEFDLGLAKYAKDRGRPFQRRLVDDAAALPGVTATAYADSLPLSIDQSSTTVFADTATDFRLSAGTNASGYNVSPGYFNVVGTRILRGRDFTWDDDDRATPVAVVNERFARVVMGVANPVGSRFRYNQRGPAIDVVGLVEDGKYVTLVEDPRPALFRPAMQVYVGNTLLLARTATGPSTAAALARLVARADPAVPLIGAGSAARMLGFAYLPVQAATIALSGFGALALMLALTGIYGVASYAVSRRTREIGIRVAVGARPREILGAMLGRVAVLVAIGAAAGLIIAAGVAPLLQAVVFGPAALDLPLVALTLAAMTLVGLVAAWVPARRALRVDPVKTLRTD